MNLGSQARQAVTDSLAAIELIGELLNEQRRWLETLLSGDSQGGLDVPGPSSRPQHRRPHRKGPPTTLRIEIDGHIVSKSQAAAGMVAAIEYLGIVRVEGLGLKLGGQPLIVRGARPNGRGYHPSGSHWIATHSDTAEKRTILKKICRRLGLSCVIRQIPRDLRRDIGDSLDRNKAA